MEKSKTRDIQKAARVQKVAEITGYSKRQVQRVINGDQENEMIMRTYMEIAEGENLLLQQVKLLVPFK